MVDCVDAFTFYFDDTTRTVSTESRISINTRPYKPSTATLRKKDSSMTLDTVIGCDDHVISERLALLTRVAKAHK
jgi:hypothetical protein